MNLDPGLVARALWDHLPVGVSVIDEHGVTRMVNRRLVELSGWATEDDLVGRSAFDFLDPADAEEFVAAFGRVGDFPDTVLGPMMLRFRDRRGTVIATEVWAYPAPPEVGFRGFVVTLTAESMADLIAAATRGIASGAELNSSLATIADAVRAYPIAAIGSILLVDNGQIVDVLGHWAFPDDRALRHLENPWAAVAAGALSGGAWLTHQLPPASARLARRHDLGAVWVQPIDTDGIRRGVLVAWRGPAIAPTPNQLTHLAEAAAAASLAFTHHDHRRRLQRAALEDHLTGVGNRARLAARARLDTKGPCGVMFIDLDFFKQVNDRHGHQMGDRVLKIAAERLTRLVRPQDEVYRVGGDEFVVVCGPSADADAAHQLVERMARFVVEAIGQPVEVDGTTVMIGASVGVAIAEGNDGLDDVLDRADEALLEAKRSGRGRWRAIAS